MVAPTTAERAIPGSGVAGTGAPLRTRWLGRVAYDEALALQRGIHGRGLARGPGSAAPEDHLLLLEHPHTYTLGRNADRRNVPSDPDALGAVVVETDRGGDVTYHGPGQLVAYPLVALADDRGLTATEGGAPVGRAWVGLLEQVLIEALASIGIVAARREGYPGVWVAGREKIAAIGVRVERGRTLHGIAVNVDPDLSMFRHFVPCGITDGGVTSVRAQGSSASLREVADAVVDAFVGHWAPCRHDRSDTVWRSPSEGSTDPGPQGGPDLSPFSRGLAPAAGAAGPNGPGENAHEGTSLRMQGRLEEAGVTQAVRITERKPPWMRARVHHDPSVMSLRSTLSDLDLVTVCEEAGCPNLSECWSAGTATFMVNGERCTRACGFCLVDTRKPRPPDPDEPARVAEAVSRMGLEFAVVTTVARDDLPDEGATQVAETVRAIRRGSPGTSVEVLISDCRGREDALRIIFDARPDVCNHNVETVPRLQRAARPSAGYARSLAVLARSVDAGLVTKSGLVLGMGETAEEVEGTLADLAAVGVSIVTMGQYLRPTAHHLPVSRWWTPREFDEFARIGRALGIAHVESSPFTRSSYHAETAAAALGPSCGNPGTRS